jgi:two-component system response regulator FixJ
MERGFPLPVIAMSGFHDERFEGEVLRLGARAFLHKPFEPQLLLDAIARATA